MKISLRAAAVVQNAILEAVRDLRIAGQIEVSVDESDIPAAIDHMAEAMKQDIARHQALMRCYYAIRKAVGQANHEHGITEKLAMIAHFDKDIALFEELCANKPREGSDVIANRVVRMTQRSEAGQRFFPTVNTISVNLLDAQDIADYRQKLRRAKHERQKLKDTITETNARVMIALCDETHACLTREEIIM